MNMRNCRHTDPRGERSDIRPEINRSELARQIGVGRSHMSRILRGQIKPTVKTLRKLAVVLGTNLDGADRFLNHLGTNHRTNHKRK